MATMIEAGDDARETRRVVALLQKFAARFDPVDRVNFYTGITLALAPIRAQLQAELRDGDVAHPTHGAV
jgi:hypothetical protein